MRPTTRLARGVSVAAGLAGVAFVVWTLARSDDVGAAVVPRPATAVAVIVLQAAALRLAAHGFAGVAGQADRRRIVRAYAASQLAKYVPGGVWQPASQIGLSTSAHGGVARASFDFGLGLAIALAAALTIGAGVAVLSPEVTPAVRAVCALGALAPVALSRRVQRRVVRTLPSIRGRTLSIDDLPPPRRMRLAFVSFAVSLAVQGLAFVLLLDADVLSTPEHLGAAAAFSVAWAVGVAAVPVPSGIGVREAVLVALVPTAGSAAVVGASVAMRVLAMVAELGFAAAVWLRRTDRAADSADGYRPVPPASESQTEERRWE